MIGVETIKQKAEEQGVNSNLVFKEYVHLITLEYLFRKGLFSQLVFHGGTALRFVYGGVRYSEDLDRFLPLAYRDLFKTKYSDICQEELQILSNLLEGFKKK